MELSELVRTLLTTRGVSSDEDVSAFLEPDYELQTHDPFLLQGMDTAVARVFAAMERNERIAVYADFDCDGIPGGALLYDLFRKLGYENMEVYLPHRDREGYGFHTEAIEALANRGVKLIITVDVGTTAVDAVAFAKGKGVDVIVTDHHEILPAGRQVPALPDAIAVLNPKRAPYPFPHLCGAAVAFKLAQAILQEGHTRELPQFKDIPVGWEKWLLDMVAVATVADMVPLIGENRVLANYGLRVLRRSQRLGIDALCNRLRMRKSELTENDIGFSLAPRINAASRMDEPDLALRLFTTQDADEAEQLAAQLEKLNASRKGVVASVVRQARATVEQRYTAGEQVVVLGNPEWKPALLGLAANSIMSDRGGVVCLWGRDAHGRIKGSCRSDGVVSLVDLFSNAGDVFEESGGHKASGGFTVSADNIHSLPEALARAAAASAAAAPLPAASPYDFLLTLSEISSPLYKDVSRLAPFGVANPKPAFLIKRVVVTDMKRFGKEKNHVELRIECRESGARCRAYDFFRTPEDFSHAPAQGGEADLIATLERDSFRGGFALRIVDVVACS
jgi:single-stranded-DNA-specific exonuclease